MNIGICCYPSYGGSGVVATELGRHLARRGHHIHFISYDKPFRLSSFHTHVTFHSVESPSYPVFKHEPYIMALANKLAEVAEREKLDILHAHYAVPHATAIYLAKQMIGGSIKTVTTLHGTDVSILSDEPNLRRVMVHSVNHSDAVTAVSENLKMQSQKVLNSEREIYMIRNFIDTSEYKRIADNKLMHMRRELGILDDDKVILHTSNFRPVKRISDVVKIFKLINESISSHLVMVGDGPDQLMAYNLVKKYNLLERVHFLGNQDCVVQILSMSDLFLLPSEKESFGLAALEAMSCEIPVIASNAGGLPEVIEHGVSGMLSEVGDVSAMAKNSISILSDDDIYNNFAKAARKRAKDRFKVNDIIDEYEGLYLKLLNN